jgi:hypothetical protein
MKPSNIAIIILIVLIAAGVAVWKWPYGFELMSADTAKKRAWFRTPFGIKRIALTAQDGPLAENRKYRLYRSAIPGLAADDYSVAISLSDKMTDTPLQTHAWDFPSGEYQFRQH